MVLFGEPRCPVRVWVGFGVLVALVSGCAGTDRPALAEWRSQWEPLVAEAPAPSEADDLDPDRCERLLVAARQARPDLEPAPTRTLDEPVIRWFDLAEEVGFECEDTVDLQGVLMELEDLEDRIDQGM